jgi:flagellar biosynthesis protein FlhG
MPDQAENLRLLNPAATPAMQALPPGPPIIVVTGARAGVGITTVAVNLAVALAHTGKRVLLVDAAREQGNLADFAGVKWSNVEHTMSDVLSGRCSAAEALMPGPAGTMVLAPRNRVSPRRESRRDSPTWPKGDSPRQAQQRLLAELQALGNNFDLLVVDLGSGLASWTRRFWLQAQLVLLVTTTDSAALMDSYAMIKRSVADGIGPDIRLIMNQCEDDSVAADAHRRLSSACRQYLARTVPAVPSLPQSIVDGDVHSMPRIWEALNTPFGHAMLWLGRAVSDVLSAGIATPTAMTAA